MTGDKTLRPNVTDPEWVFVLLLQTAGLGTVFFAILDLFLRVAVKRLGRCHSYVQ